MTKQSHKNFFDKKLLDMIPAPRRGGWDVCCSVVVSPLGDGRRRSRFGFALSRDLLLGGSRPAAVDAASRELVGVNWHWPVMYAELGEAIRVAAGAAPDGATETGFDLFDDVHFLLLGQSGDIFAAGASGVNRFRLSGVAPGKGRFRYGG